MQEAIAALKARWLEVYPDFARIRADILASVTRLEWMSGAAYDPRPFYFQRGNTQGRPLRRAPKPGEYGKWKCGYDAQGRVVLIGEDESWEWLYRYLDDGVECLTYQVSFDVPRGISRLYAAKKQFDHYAGFFLAGSPDDIQGDADSVWQKGLKDTLNLHFDYESYTYQANRLTMIHPKHIEHLTTFQAQSENLAWDRQPTFRLDYDAAGELAQVTLNGKITFRSMPRGQTLKSLTTAAQTGLIAAIPDIVQRANFTEPLYCLQLNYNFYAGDFFPPGLMAGLESWRNAVMQNQSFHFRRTEEIWGTVWNPSTLLPPLIINDKSVLEVCAHLQNAIVMNGVPSRKRQAVQALYELAQALNQLNWQQYAPVTPDFIVFVSDHRSTVPTSLAKSGATPAQIEDWKKRGFL